MSHAPMRMPVGLRVRRVGRAPLLGGQRGASGERQNEEEREDLPPIWWTPILGFRAGRRVSDEHNASGIFWYSPQGANLLAIRG